MALVRSLLLVLAALCCAPASAQEFPAKPVRIVVPWPTGGSADIVTRLVAQKLSEIWGQPVNVDNRGGASGNLGADIVARSAPDGYTLMYGAMSTHAMNQWLYPKMSFDPVKDFDPVCLMLIGTTVLVAPTSFPANSVGELIALARSKPGRLTYASVGNGSFSHLAAEMLRLGTGIEVVHVPYKGGNPALVDLVGERVDFLFIGAPPTIPYLKAGRLKNLAVADAKRAATLPDVPTVGETVSGYDISVWAGILAPAGMPRPLLEKINRDVRRAIEDPDTRAKLVELGSVMVGSTPDEFRARMVADAEKWGRIIRQANVKLD